jgi:hypothetical protein
MGLYTGLGCGSYGWMRGAAKAVANGKPNANGDVAACQSHRKDIRRN